MNSIGKFTGILIVALTLFGAVENAQAKDAPPTCPGKKGDVSGVLDAGKGEDIVIVGRCVVPAGEYTYGNVNIVKSGTLVFMDATIDFYAKSILVEDGGALIAGYDTAKKEVTPIGTVPGSVLSFYLYGDQVDEKTKVPRTGGIGIPCVQSHCGVPQKIWCSQPNNPKDPHEAHNGCDAKDQTGAKVKLPNADDDYFYRYHPLFYDDGVDTNVMKQGYFGYKVIGVAYGGTLQLFGKHGSTLDPEAALTNPALIDPKNSGSSWRRLAATARVGTDQVVLDQPADWVKDDWIVITSTDYLPGHSEKRQIKENSKDGGKTFTVSAAFEYVHNGSQFDLADAGVPARLGLPSTKMENRAAVALLTRSIRIISDGDKPKGKLSDDSYFGGHMVIRQGVAKFQMQGVELVNLGQGGRIGHYPVHFHHARKVPADTVVKDTTVNESMTRWFTLHSTHGVTLARNVGWKSIGHGYYLEDGTEIDNNLFSNIGIYARASLDYPDNPRKVPGILSAALWKDPKDPNAYKTENVPFYSDHDHPAVFWIMNGWNRFEYNMAVGASACGICYWMLPGAVSGMSREMKWEGYAAIQVGEAISATTRAGLSPVKSFVGNFCSAAALSFNTVANTSACLGVGTPEVSGYISIPAIPNPFKIPDPCDQSNPKQKPPNGDKYEPWSCNQPGNEAALEYYPQIGGGGRFPTRCDKGEACETVTQCGGDKIERCMVTVIDQYTTSFQWAETNFAALWLRPQWYLVSNSFITDVVNAGLTFVTGGGYTDSDAPRGHWALAYRTAFIGQTQKPGTPAATAFTSDMSPFNNQTGSLKCATGAGEGNRCISLKDGVSFPRSNFGVGQRLFNIYDGPAYQSSNAYLNITKATVGCNPSPNPGGNSNCPGPNYLVGFTTGLPRDGNTCYMPNAAIGWKQPNGFYYPPAFHSDNLYFNNVDIRHYVIQPLFKEGTYLTDDDPKTGVWAHYCNWTSNMFSSAWTDIDRQTELNDDDGSLTGYKDTISVNKDPFFSGPEEDTECASDDTAKTSPYDYVTSVVYPACGLDGSCPTVTVGQGSYSSWNSSCANEQCFGVPLYRQYDTDPKGAKRHAIRMAGQDTFQRSTLATNNGVYYMDTTIGADAQVAAKPARNLLNVFMADNVYYSFVLYAKPTTKQTYQIYVGKTPKGDTNGFNVDTDVWPVRVAIRTAPPVYYKDNVVMPKNWAKKYDPDTGILEITMDMTGDTTFEAEYKAGLAAACQPNSFCTLSGSTCKGIPGVIGSTDAVCSWAGKDTACPLMMVDNKPVSGCWGIGFKLSKNFDTLPKPTEPPAMQCFTPETGAPWYGQWKDPDSKIEQKGNTCYKPPHPVAVACKK